MKTPIRNRVWAVMLPALALLAACSQDDGFTNDSDPVAVNFTAGIEAAGPAAYSAAGGTRATAHEFTGTADAGVPYRDYTDADGFATRAFYPGGTTATTTRTTDGGDGWTTIDRVGIFMLAAGGDIATASDRLADNVQYNVTNAATGALSPDGGMPIYYPQAGNVDFAAYYPYGSKGTNAGQVTPGYLYYIGIGGQADEAAQNARDVLYAKTTNVAKSQTAVGLTFGHVLSKITLNVTLCAGFTGSGDVTAVVFSGMPQTATMALQDGSLSAGAAGNFDALKAATANPMAVATFSALLVPQPTGGSGRTAVFTVDGAPYTWTIPNMEAFAAGSHYTYPVTVNETGITVGAPTIADWNTYDNGSGAAEKLDVVKIKAGTFLMGSSDGSQVGIGTPGIDPNATAAEPNRRFDETQHWVTLTQDFWMSKYEITNAQYAAFLNAVKAGSDGRFTAADYPAGQYPDTELVRDCSQSGSSAWGVKWEADKWVPVDDAHKDHPVIYVTWYGADEYAKWIGGALPTEAQWEYACRGGEANKPFGIGDGYTLDNTLANFNWRYSWSWDGSSATADQSATGSGSLDATQKVGSYAPNAWGLYDMHGNVWEWCSDWHDSYGSIDVIDPTGPGSGYGRVQRGGSYVSDALVCRSAFRSNYYPDDTYYGCGFRVVFVP